MENDHSQAHFKVGTQGDLPSSPVETDGGGVRALVKISAPGELEVVPGEAKGPALEAGRPDLPVIDSWRRVYLASTYVPGSGPLGPSGCAVYLPALFEPQIPCL